MFIATFRIVFSSIQRLNVSVELVVIHTNYCFGQILLLFDRTIMGVRRYHTPDRTLLLVCILSPPVAWAAVRSKVMVLLLLTFCLLLLPLWESVIVLCFVIRYFMSILVLQSS